MLEAQLAWQASQLLLSHPQSLPDCAQQVMTIPNVRHNAALALQVSRCGAPEGPVVAEVLRVAGAQARKYGDAGQEEEDAGRKQRQRPRPRAVQDCACRT